MELDLTDVTVASICKGKSPQRKEYYLILRKDYNEGTIKDKLNNADTKEDTAVMMFDYNGNLIKEFNTAVEAANELNTTDVTIHNICHNVSKQRKEYYLIYSKEYDEETISDKINNADKVIDKRVVKTDYNGNIIRLYDTATEAAKDCGYSVVTIAKICTGKMKQREDYYLLYNEYYSEETIKDLIRK